MATQWNSTCVWPENVLLHIGQSVTDNKVIFCNTKKSKFEVTHGKSHMLSIHTNVHRHIFMKGYNDMSQ